MDKNNVKIYYGEGKGKSALSLGRALICASEGKSVFVIQFLKGRQSGELEYLKKLEPDIKFFRFEKNDKYFEDLEDEEREDEIVNIRNGINFAKKVLKIGECDVLILDEVLGLEDLGIISSEELCEMINMTGEDTELILTGINLPADVIPCAGYIARLDIVKLQEKNE